jgi:DNA polymerase-3 subunit beta
MEEMMVRRAGENGITIEAALLAKAMKNAAAIVASSNTIPILSNVKLVAEGETLTLTTSDLDIEFRQAVPLARAGQLAITVDARRLAALAGAAASGAQLSLEETEGRVTARSGRARWVLPALPATDFPSLPPERLCAALEIEGKALATALGRVSWSASSELTRAYLGGVFLNAEAGKVRLVTTNGHTLALVQLAADFPEGGAEVILPTKFVHTLEKLAGEHGGAVALAWDDRKVRAEVGPVVLTGKVIEGNFPDYRRVIPALVDGPVICEPAGLRAALRRVALVSDGKSNAVKLARDTGKLVVSVASQEGGTASEELPADCTGGFETGFNGNYLANMLDAIGGDSVALHHGDAGAPSRWQRVVDDGALCVVMPVRV